MDPRRRKRDVDGAEENIWTQEGGSEGRIVLRGIFGPKREIVK